MIHLLRQKATRQQVDEILQAAELVELQVKLALWDLESRQNWNDENWRSELASKAQQWSQRILEMSGLLRVA